MKPEKNKLWVIVLIISAIDTGLFFWFRVTWGDEQFGVLGIAFGISMTIFIQLIIGAVLNNIERTATYGKGLLVASCIMLLIGFGICTIAA